MATFVNRARTLATAGLLSATAITIATNGILQLPKAVAPEVTVPVNISTGAAPGRILPGRPFELQYSKRHEHRSVLELYPYGVATFGHQHLIPLDVSHRTTLDIYLYGDGYLHNGQYYDARSKIDVALFIDSTAKQSAPIPGISADNALTVESDVYVRFVQAGTVDFTSNAALTLTSTAEVYVEHETPLPRGTVFEFVSDNEPELIEAAVRFDKSDVLYHTHAQELQMRVEGAARIKFDTQDYTRYIYRSDNALDIASDAAHAAALSSGLDARHVAAVHAALSGAAYSTITRDVLPHAFDDDEEVLLLFAKMMREIDEG